MSTKFIASTIGHLANSSISCLCTTFVLKPIPFFASTRTASNSLVILFFYEIRRTVVSIPNGPSALAVKEAAWGLARYAAISQVRKRLYTSNNTTSYTTSIQKVDSNKQMMCQLLDWSTIDLFQLLLVDPSY